MSTTPNSMDAQAFEMGEDELDHVDGHGCVENDLDECDHEGWVVRGICGRCGMDDLYSDEETYEQENPR
jgi:hypothetical protein